MDRLHVVLLALLMVFMLHLVSPVVTVLTGGIPGSWTAFAQENEDAGDDDPDEAEDDTDDDEN